MLFKIEKPADRISAPAALSNNCYVMHLLRLLVVEVNVCQHKPVDRMTKSEYTFNYCLATRIQVYNKQLEPLD
jgi:hypothetical protein